jgi:hypothetical protein
MRTTLLSVAIGASLLGCRGNDAAQSEAVARAASDPRVETTTADIGTATAMAEGKPGDATIGAHAQRTTTARQPLIAPAPEPTRPSPPTAITAEHYGVVTASPTPSPVGGFPGSSPTPPPVAAPASAHVAAGEWDDNANYRDYLKWIAGTHRAELATNHRELIVVTDAHGKPVPNCEVRVSAGQATAMLTTTAAGRALLFPIALGLGERASYDADVRCGDQHASATLDTAQVDTVNRIELKADRALPARRTVDLAFVLDTTGSMAEEIEAVKSTINTVATKLQNEQVDLRIGLVEYRDRVDAEVTHVYPFSTDATAFGASVRQLHAAGGGDYPEDMQMGLQTAVDNLQWSSTSIARLAVVIADAPPHRDYRDERSYADTAKRAAARGIKLYTVAASGMDEAGQIVMRELAQFTGATEMFVLRGGAGPQSVGGGDPNSSCGGTHTNYSSGNLDALILAKVRNELASVDADPLVIAGVGQDENAKPCEKRVQIARNQ